MVKPERKTGKKVSSNTKGNASQLKPQKGKVTGVTVNVSDRLRILSMPSGYLVEAVLKQHSHIFSEDCRDRLRRLLQAIGSMNGSSKRKFARLNEKLNIKCIKSLQMRLKDLESEKLQELRKRDAKEAPSGIAMAEKNSSLLCNVSSSSPDDSLAENLKDLNEDHKGTELKHRDLKQGLKREPVVRFSNVRECYHFDVVSDNGSVRGGRTHRATVSETAACGDHDADVQVLWEGRATTHEPPGERGDFRPDTQSLRTKALKCKSQQNTPTPRPGSTKSLKKRSLPVRHEIKDKANLAPKMEMADHKKDQEEGEGEMGKNRKKQTKEKERSLVEAPHRYMNVPTMAVRAYIVLITDMQRNCILYETFRRHMIKPLELYKEPYIDAAYACWMDYMRYVKNTLEYLHPYMMTLVGTYYTAPYDDPRLVEYETKLPKVLINSMKNIKPWRKALNETIDCCTHLFIDESVNRDSILRLYTRYYEKICKLHPIAIDDYKGDSKKRS